MTWNFEQDPMYDEDPLAGDVDRWVHPDETRSDTERDFDERYAVDPYDDYEDGENLDDGGLPHDEAAGLLVRSVLDFGRYDESGEEYKKNAHTPIKTKLDDKRIESITPLKPLPDVKTLPIEHYKIDTTTKLIEVAPSDFPDPVEKVGRGEVRLPDDDTELRRLGPLQ